MKCPKCGYLGFKHVERCPNCGYDFSLSSSPALLDLSIRPSSQNTPRPLADLALVDAGLSLSSPEPKPEATAEIGSVQISPPPAPTPELPLFGSPGLDDAPLITRASPPRTPLAVRRATPEVPKLRRTPSSLDFSDLDAKTASSLPTPPARRGPAYASHAPEPATTPAGTPAAVSARVLAALIDVVLRTAIDVAVVYFTMQIVGVTFGEFAIVPKVPLIAFLIVQNISYFVLFTAGGQTMGQMALGIKVISDDAGASPDFSHAMVRTVVWTVLAVPAGLGLATALFSPDRRGLHDRFSGTRVVRAGA
ncbi:MAG TPA: RDD family protein [Vicinamibacterales bacterium]